MDARQPLPRLWLMTDERLGESLLDVVARLPEGAGIVFRHYSLGEVARRDLFEKVRAAHPGMLLLAGTSALAAKWEADGSHGRGAGAGFRSAPVHDYAEIRDAERNAASLLFLSPAYPTNSHPGTPALGIARFAWLARRTALPVIALGGMNAARGKRLASFGAYGWAGIDAFAR
jgi:thiamine-phosphate pyrophosphorylase